MNKDDTNANNNLIKRRSIKDQTNQSSLMDLLEGEKALRFLQHKFSIEEMKGKVLKQKMEQSKNNHITLLHIEKKIIDGLRGEIKRYKISVEKNKEQIGLLIRESAFLKEMIEFSLNKIK